MGNKLSSLFVHGIARHCGRLDVGQSFSTGIAPPLKAPSYNGFLHPST